MGKIQVNPSTGKVFVSRDSAGNSKLCSDCCVPSIFAPDDCCCFLNPDSDAYNAGTTYAESDLAEHASGTYQSLQDNNLNNPLVDTDWWEKVSNNTSCENANWNSVPPFGGPGSTPAHYTFTFKVTWAVSALTTTYHSIALIPLGLVVTCPYVDDFTTEESDGNNVHSFVNVRGFFGVSTATFIGFRNTNRSCAGGALFFTGDTIINVAAFVGACNIAGTYECSHDGGACCMVRSTDFDLSTTENGSVVCAWRPGQIPAWNSGIGYVIGDVVAHEGVFYECTADNTNQEPPNGAFWVVV